MIIFRPLNTASRLKWIALAVLFSVLWISAGELRLATYNIRFGMENPDSPEYRASRAIINRLQPDVIALQELRYKNMHHLRSLAEETGYEHMAVSENGPFSGNLLTGFISRYPITKIENITSPPSAKEMSRIPLAIELDLPDLDTDPLLITVHLKANFARASEFRRAVELMRVLKYVQKQVVNDTPVFILGDFNDDINRGQTAFFEKAPSDLPGTFRLGGDMAFPVRYAPFPATLLSDHGFHMLDTVQRNGRYETFPGNKYRIDYIFYNDAVKSMGQLSGAIYNSRLDRGPAGMTRFGPRPAQDATEKASDHLPVYADFIYRAN